MEKKLFSEGKVVFVYSVSLDLDIEIYKYIYASGINEARSLILIGI